MANLTSAINVNVPAEVKEESNNIFNNLGLNMSTAINMFLKRVIYERGIPFDVKEPTPTKELLTFTVDKLYDKDKNLIDVARHPDEIYYIEVDVSFEVEEYSMLRREII